MNPDVIRKNINTNVDQWYSIDDDRSLKPIVCILCDRFILPHSIKYLSLDQLSHHQTKFYNNANFNLDTELLSCYKISLPDLAIPVNGLEIQKCLLSPRSTFIHSVSGPIGYYLCNECNSHIMKDKRPAFCIANNYCFGLPPKCLLELTDIERAFITPVRTYGYQFCYTGGKKHKLVGSLIHYKMDTGAIIRSIAELTKANVNIVVVLYGSLTKKQYQKAKQKSHLRINYLRHAIEWLLQHNNEWRSMNISSTAYRTFIESLHDYTIPELHYDVSVTDDEDTQIESNEILHIYYPDGNSNINTGGQKNIEALQELVREANLNNDDIACKFNIFQQAVSDYKGNNLVNACLLQYPYGRGGMTENRKTLQDKDTNTVDMEKYLEYVSMLSLPNFHEGLFTLITYNMMIRLKMVRTANWQIRNKLDASMLATELSWEDVESAINATKIARGTLTDQQARGRHLLTAVDAVCKTAPHCNDAAKQAKRKAEALQHYYGCPTFFLTVTPDDDNHFCIQIMSGEFIDNNSSLIQNTNDEDLIQRSKLRTLLRLKYPGVCALYFEMALNTVLIEVLGWNIESKKQDSLGLFGTLDAFSCSIEEQGRSTLHAHLLIWVKNVNKLRQDLHDTDTQSNAKRLIQHVVNKVASCKSCFNDINLESRIDDGVIQRKKFHHDCITTNYGLPIFPTDEELMKLRLDKTENLTFIKCKHCQHTWNFTDLHESYLKDYLKVPHFTTFMNENKVRRFKALAIEYQKNVNQTNVAHYAIDYGYNLHKHTSSCFKLQKSDKKRIFQTIECSCRYRYPQKKRRKTIIQNVTEQLMPWYNWYGTYDMRNIKEICVKREPYDAFQNTYVPAISYSKLTCNTNVQFLNPGPFGGYCFHYSMKSTQKDDIQPYEKLRKSMGTIISAIKYHDNDRLEAIRRLLAASFTHQADTTIRPTLASYLIRNKSRFIFSHEFAWCPLQNLSSLTTGKSVTAAVSFNNNMKPVFVCSALNYLCRPILLENLCPFEFYSQYEIVNFSKQNEQRGAIRLNNTLHFTHPSFNIKKNVCTKSALRRTTDFLVQIQQYLFCNTSDFQVNMLLNDTPITDEIENYCHLILHLFMPYRCISDLLLNGKYTYKLRQAIISNNIHPQHSTFLQNIQDCKYNNFRFDIKNDDLDRAPEPFSHNNINSNRETENDDLPFTGLPTNIQDSITANMIHFLTTDLLHFFGNNDNITFALSSYNADIIRRRGVYRSGYNCLPANDYNDQTDPLYSELGAFVLNTTNNEITNNIQTPTVKPISIEKKTLMQIFIGFNHQLFDLNLNKILGRDQLVQVAMANGTAHSIVNWGNICGLDHDQQTAFEIITGYYILSYIYALKDMDDNDIATINIKREQRRLQHLVRHSTIKSNQLVCFLHGPGGSGKSTVISLLQQYSQEYHTLLKHNTYNRSIVITAMTGVAATIIGGETAHSAMCLNSKHIRPDQIELWTNTKLLVIDEISFANNYTIEKIHENLSILNDNKTDPYGGLHIIFCGDLRQLEPVNGNPLYRHHNIQSSIFKLHMNCYIELNGQHRFKQDPEWGRILHRFREGETTDSDIVAINQRHVKPNKTNIPTNIKYATYKNRDRDAINTGIFMEKLYYSAIEYSNTENFIMIFSDKISIQKDASFMPLTPHRTQFFYENCGESNIKPTRNGRLDPVLKLYKNCEVMLTENIDVLNGLANGTRATLQNVTLQQNHNCFYVNVGKNILVKGVYASSIEYIVLKHVTSTHFTQTFKIQPKSISFKATIPYPTELISPLNNQKQEEFSMKAFQIPIIVNNATTGHKLQGTGVDKLFVHGWHYRRNWPYVVLSRVRQRNGLFLRHQINNNKKKYKVDNDLITLIAYFRNLRP